MHISETKDWVAKRLSLWRIPGAAVAIVNGSEDCAYGLGRSDVADSAKVDEYTLFPLASNTKSLSTVLTETVLNEAGVAWNTELVKFIPELAEASADQLRSVTFEEIHSHQSGMASFDLLCRSGVVTSRRELIQDRLRYIPALQPARQQYHYSNLMFLAGAHAIEQISGKPWDDLLSELCENRLGLEKIKYSLDEVRHVENVATPHRFSAELGTFVSQAAVPLSAVAAPAGAVWCSPRDMLKLMRLHLSGDGARETLLSGMQLERLRGIRIPCPNPRLCLDEATDLSYSLGWGVANYGGERVLFHAGEAGALCVLTVLIPDRDLGVSVFCNALSRHAPKGKGCCFRCCIAFGILDQLLAPQGALECDCEPWAPAQTESRVIGTSIIAEDWGLRHLGAYRNPAFGDISLEPTREGRVQIVYGTFGFDLTRLNNGNVVGISKHLPEMPIKVKVDSGSAKVSATFEPAADYFEFTRLAE